jgi:L-asparaginase/Glu-tRNA(Gln) amidotransferase subunit D
MSGPSIPHKTVLVVTLGGTVAMTQSEGNGLVPTLSGNRLLEQLREYVAVNIEIVSRLLVASPALSFASIRDLAVFLDKNLERPEIDGAVVVQGTDTIEETSYLLELLLATPHSLVARTSPPENECGGFSRVFGYQILRFTPARYKAASSGFVPRLQ